MGIGRKYPSFRAEWSIHAADGSETRIYPVRWNINRKRGEPTTWSIECPIKQLDLAPYPVPSSTYDGKLLCDPYDASFVLRRWFRCRLFVGGQEWISPKLLHLDYGATASTKANTVVLSGMDQHDMLLTAGQVMGDVRSDIGGIKMAKATVAEILAHVGITSHSLLFEDFPIQSLHRVGTPFDWLREIFDVRQCWGRLEGDTYVVEPGGIDLSKSTAEWALTASQSLKVLNFRRHAVGIVNEAHCVRVNANQGGALSNKGEGLGIVTVPLKFPVNYGVAKVNVLGYGFAHTFSWLNGDIGLSVAPSEVYIGATPATHVRFVLEPGYYQGGLTQNTGQTITSLPYEITVRGGQHNSGLGQFDESYDSSYIDVADQAVRGKRPAKQPLVKSMIGSKPVADDFIKRWVREGLRHYETASGSALCNPLMGPGQVATLTYAGFGMESTKFVVEGVSMAGDERTATMSLEFSRPAAA